MTNFTPQQKRVLNAVKVLQAEYQEGVPYNILKLDLDIPEEDLTAILGYLKKENYISREDGLIILKKENEKEEMANTSHNIQLREDSKLTLEDNSIESPADGSDDKNDVSDNDADNTEDNQDTVEVNGVEVKNELSETEQQALELIQKIVDDSGNVSRSLLEGTLLYGKLELSSIRMYNLITALENKGILKKIQLIDGEYYKFTP